MDHKNGGLDRFCVGGNRGRSLIEVCPFFDCEKLEKEEQNWQVFQHSYSFRARKHQQYRFGAEIADFDPHLHQKGTFRNTQREESP